MHEIHKYVRGRSPSEDLLSAVDEYEADLLVIGHSKRTAAGKAVLGSNAHDILMGATCPVLATMSP